MTKIENSSKMVPDVASLTLLFNALYHLSLREHLLKIDSVAEYAAVLSFFGGSTCKIYEVTYPEDVAPDICANCLSVLRETIGGRVRLGCTVCKECDNRTRVSVTFFSVFSGLCPEEAMFYLSMILATKQKKGNSNDL